jgi:hypothetical protein
MTWLFWLRYAFLALLVLSVSGLAYLAITRDA